MNCPYCGRYNAAEDALFCNYCGVRFSDYQYAAQQSQLQYQAPAQDQSAYYQQQTQAPSGGASGGPGEGYNWDNFTKFLNTNTKPKDKPTSGKCGKCGSTQLEFFDSGIGTCFACGKEFRWDGATKPQRPDARPPQQQAQRQSYQQPAASYQQPARQSAPQVGRPAAPQPAKQPQQQTKPPTYQQPSKAQPAQAPYQAQAPSREDQSVVAVKQNKRSIPAYVQEDAPAEDIIFKEHQRNEETYMEWTEEDDKLFAMEEAEAKEEDEVVYDEGDDDGPVNDIKAYIEKGITEDDEELAAIEKMIKLKHLLKTKKITEYEYKWWEKKIKSG